MPLRNSLAAQTRALVSDAKRSGRSTPFVLAVNLFVVALFWAAPASNAQIIVPVSAMGTGTFINPASLIIDGVIPPDGSPYFNANNIVRWQGLAPQFTIDLGSLHTISDIVVSLDNNDTYILESSTDGVNYSSVFTVLSSYGQVAPNPGGMDEMNSIVGTTEYVSQLDFASFNARYFRIYATGTTGGNDFGIGEIQAIGAVAVAAPEPGTLTFLALVGVPLLAVGWRRHGKKRAAWRVATSAVALGAMLPAAQAQVTLYAHDPRPTSDGGRTSSTVNGTQGFQAFDSFQMDAGAAINQVSWRGVYYDSANPGANPVPPNTTNWQIGFFNDSAGSPGSGAYSVTLPAGSVTTAFVGAQSFFDGSTVNVYDFTASLSTAFQAAKNTTYWFSPLSQQPTFGPVMSWTFGMGGNDRAIQRSLSNGSQSVAFADHNLRLSGEFLQEDGYVYRYDSGKTDNAIAIVAGEPFTETVANWFQVPLSAPPAASLIDSISIRWGDVTPGSALAAKLWLDPNNDGNPADALLVSSLFGEIQSGDSENFVTYDIPNVSVAPGSSFFVGATLTYNAPDPITEGGDFPFLYTMGGDGHSWYGRGSDLSGASNLDSDLYGIGRKDFAIRANAITTLPVVAAPEPGTLALLLPVSLAGLALCRRRRKTASR